MSSCKLYSPDYNEEGSISYQGLGPLSEEECENIIKIRDGKLGTLNAYEYFEVVKMRGGILRYCIPVSKKDFYKEIAFQLSEYNLTFQELNHSLKEKDYIFEEDTLLDVIGYMRKRGYIDYLIFPLDCEGMNQITVTDEGRRSFIFSLPS